MRRINMRQVKSEDLLDHAAISQAFKEYLMDVLKYEEDEADLIISNDFENPYNTPYILMDIKGRYKIGGQEYEAWVCHTDFSMCGLEGIAKIPPFRFYMLFDLKTMPDDTVGSYQRAEKKYLL